MGPLQGPGQKKPQGFQAVVLSLPYFSLSHLPLPSTLSSTDFLLGGSELCQALGVVPAYFCGYQRAGEQEYCPQHFPAKW